MSLSDNFNIEMSYIKRNFNTFVIGVCLLATLVAIIPYRNVFAADDLNSINPNFQGDQSQSSSSPSDSQGDQSQSSSSDSSQSHHPSVLGKAACGLVMGGVGKVVGNMLLPGAGGIVGGAVGSNACG